MIVPRLSPLVKSYLYDISLPSDRVCVCVCVCGVVCVVCVCVCVVCVSSWCVVGGDDEWTSILDRVSRDMTPQTATL